MYSDKSSAFLLPLTDGLVEIRKLWTLVNLMFELKSDR